MKKISILLIIIIVLSGCSNNNDDKNYINTKEVYELIDSDSTYIIDVRSEEEYSTGHIKGAINIPVDKIDNIFTIIEDKESKIIIYCRSGARSSAAYDIIKSYGYNNIYDMKGINDWEYELVEE